MEKKQAIFIGVGCGLGLILLIGLVIFLRLRNAPQEDLAPLIAGQANVAGSQVKPGLVGKSGLKDNGYTVVPYEQLPKGTPYKVVPGQSVPTFADPSLPIGMPDGTFRRNN